MSECAALGPIGECCSRGEHTGDRHAHRSELTREEIRRTVASGERAIRLGITSEWRGDFAGKRADPELPTGGVMAYMLHRAFRSKRNAVLSWRVGGAWKHTGIDGARTWSLKLELGKRVVGDWVTEAA